MLKQFQNFIDKEFPNLKLRKVLLAVSGGVDSIVMMKLFELAELNFAVAHCNFQLRDDESDGDETFIKSIAKKSGIKIHTKKFETKKFAAQRQLSTQMAARELRYEWFNELSEKYGYDFIATAHHQTDVAETILINQVRGTGLAGMHGILPLHGKIIRPLLFTTHDELFAFAQAQKIKWREDSSNSHDDYVRNKIRQKVLPVLKEINPSLEKTFTENARHFYDAEILLQGFLEVVRRHVFTSDKNNIYMVISKLNQYENAPAMLYFLLREFGFKNAITSAIYENMGSTSGKKFLSETHQLTTNRDQLIITKLHDETQLIHNYYEIQEGDDGLIGDGFSLKIKRISLSKTKKIDFIKSPDVAYFDADKISFPLQLRTWKKGDYFHPIGMKGRRKKLSDYFTDEKISLPDKEHIWLLLSGNEICWVIGKRSDERFKVTAETKKMLQIAVSF
ncbi:MAG: tRNA lysidine(34) synthetase TilS [Bacteroidia bacterium]